MAELDVRDPAVLGDVEFDQELTLDAPIAGLPRIDPVGLDPLPDLVEVVLVLRLRSVERNRLALHAAAAASRGPPAPAGLPTHGVERARHRDLGRRGRGGPGPLARGRLRVGGGRPGRPRPGPWVGAPPPP